MKPFFWPVIKAKTLYFQMFFHFPRKSAAARDSGRIKFSTAEKRPTFARAVSRFPWLNNATCGALWPHGRASGLDFRARAQGWRREQRERQDSAFEPGGAFSCL